MRRLLLSFAFLGFLALPAWAIPAHVQTTGIISGSATGGGVTAPLTFGSPITSGDLAGACFEFGSGVTISGVADDKSNAYTLAETFTDPSSNTVSCYYHANTTNAPTIVTATVNFAVLYTAVGDEFSGIATTSPVDGTPNAALTSITSSPLAVVSGTTTTTTNGDEIWGIAIATAAASTPLTPGSGFTGFGAGNSGGTSFGAYNGTTFAFDPETEGQVQATAGAIQASFTATSTTFANEVVMVIALKPAGGGAPTPGAARQPFYHPGPF